MRFPKRMESELPSASPPYEAGQGRRGCPEAAAKGQAGYGEEEGLKNQSHGGRQEER